MVRHEQTTIGVSIWPKTRKEFCSKIEKMVEKHFRNWVTFCLLFNPIFMVFLVGSEAHQYYPLIKGKL